jgi:hypothetical protein
VRRTLWQSRCYSFATYFAASRPPVREHFIAAMFQIRCKTPVMCTRRYDGRLVRLRSGRPRVTQVGAVHDLCSTSSNKDEVQTLANERIHSKDASALSCSLAEDGTPLVRCALTASLRPRSIARKVCDVHSKLACFACLTEYVDSHWYRTVCNAMMSDRTLGSTMRLQMLGCAGRVMVLITSLVWVSLWWCSLDLSGET